MDKEQIIEKEYFLDLERIKSTINENRNKAMVIANSAMIMTYYQIGTIINKRRDWGDSYIIRLSNDLSEYGKGFSKFQLYKMINFLKNFL